MLDLSIIIPIYNTPQEALARCFASMDSLTDVSYEVLLIDDGSEESTGVYCRNYTIDHPEFSYHRKENGGVSSARNKGLALAQGRFVMFVDADDVLFGETITAQTVTGDADLVIFDMYLQENGRDILWRSLPCEEGPVSQKTLQKHLLMGKSLNSPCVKLFRRGIIENAKLRFRTDMITGEDWLFVTNFTGLCTSAYYTGKPCYRYFRDEGTGLGRTTRFPDTMIDNHHLIMQTKRQLAHLGTPDWSYEDVIGVAASMHVEDMFNTAADLKLSGLLTKERKRVLQQAVATAGAELTHGGSRKAKIKRFILMRLPIMLWPLAKLREYYLKHK